MSQKIKKLDSVLIKPAGPDCNMSCSYCFYLNKSELFPDSKTHRMRVDVLEETVNQVMTQGQKQLSFSWQGGEPTLMGLSFYEKAVKLQQKYGHGHLVGNSLQTNGLLLDERWAKFLKKYNFLVGLSLDGPEHIHDRYRLLRNGNGSWSRAMDKAKLLLDSGVEVNALVVLNDHSVLFPEEIYEFHKSLGLNYMQFIPCVELDPQNLERGASFSVPPEKYGEFLSKVFDLWLADFEHGMPATSVRFFDSVLFSYAGLNPPQCTLLEECGSYVVIEHNGDVFSCDFFVEPDWKLGNVLENNLAALLNSEKQDEFGRMKSALPMECRECQWLHYCRAGCIKDRLHNPRDKTLNYLCPSYKIFFHHADRQFRQMADEWKRQQIQAGAQGVRKIGRNDPCPCGSEKKYKKCCGRNA